MIMQNLKLTVVSLIVLLSLGAFAAPTETAKKKTIVGESQTEHSFEDLLVQGKYHFSDESVTTVEEDKVLDALIGVRNDFKDRLENSAERN
ncbi:MAG: hypothetical protein ACK5P7_12850 [Bdellovibrio sp.]|jgi:hypothetical protein